MKRLAVLFTANLLLSGFAFGQGKRIVTYIEDVQEERKSTRWTLTEWLRIKERMKMMDVWLAMFSDPKKDRFAPELGLSYGRTGGVSTYNLGSSLDFNNDKRTTERDNHGEEARVQFWFTNLISGTTGLRTLAIDLGLEGRVVNRFPDTQTNLDGASGFLTDTDKLQQAGVNLRLFGANEQDSGLVAKFGQFQKFTGFEETAFKDISGTYFGGEMQLYFLSWLGVEGNYYGYTSRTGAKSKGSSLDYFGFLEISAVRLGYGVYDHEWSTDDLLTKLKTQDDGKYFLLRLYL